MADLQAIFLRQQDSQNDQVIRRSLSEILALLSIAGAINGVAIVSQARCQ